jgi:hypothetical protein
MKINSIITEKIQDIYSASSLNDAKQVMNNLLINSKIKETDKNKMLDELNNITTLNRMYFFATNCMLKYEGLGVN